MNLLKLTVGPLKTNCYLLTNNKKQCLIIDPGDDSEYISSKIQENGLIPVAIFATHGHFDHVLASGELQMIYNIPFYCHKKDLFLIKSLRERAKYWLKRKIYEIVPQKIRNYKKSFQTAGFEIRILELPGHTPGGVGIYVLKEKVLFSGDTIFSQGSVGRFDFSYSRKLQLVKSVDLILQLPNDTGIFPGHGESTNVKKEKGYHKQA